MAVKGIAVTGLKEIDDVLRGLPLQLEHRVLQAGFADAAKLIVNKAKLLAPEGPTGGLVDSIGVVKPGFTAAEGIGEVHVGPRRGKFKGHHAHLVETGTVKRNKTGPNRGTMPAHPFMGPAFEQTNTAVLETVRLSIGRKLYAFMRRTIKK